MCQSYLNKEGKEKKKEKIMASSLITLWQIDGETMETVTDFLFLGSTIIADGDFSHEIKRRLLLGRKAMTNLDSMLNSYGTAPGLFGHTSCQMPGWMKHKLESRLPGEISITSDTQMTPPLWQKVKRNKKAS